MRLATCSSRATAGCALDLGRPLEASKMNGDPLYLARYFTYVAPASATSIVFDWHPFDSSFITADLVIDVKSADTGTVTVSVQSSLDGATVSTLGSTNVDTNGRTTTTISSGLLTMIRLVLSSSSAAARMILSVTLVPKRA